MSHFPFKPEDMRGAWYLLHELTVEADSPQKREAVSWVIYILRLYFFCLNCRSHLERSCEEKSPEDYMENQDTLFYLTWFCHDKASEHAGNEQISLDEGRNIYFGRNFNEYSFNHKNLSTGFWYLFKLLVSKAETQKQRTHILWIIYVISKKYVVEIDRNIFIDTCKKYPPTNVSKSSFELFKWVNYAYNNERSYYNESIMNLEDDLNLFNNSKPCNIDCGGPKDDKMFMDEKLI